MSPDRREALQLIAGAGLTGLAGCLGEGGGSTETTTTTVEETSTTSTTSTTDSTPTTERTDDTKVEHVVIENRDTESRVATIEVQADDGSVLLSGTYDVPAKTGIEFDREFEWRTYTVRGKVEGGDWHSMSWEPNSCASTPAPDGDMNAGVVVTADGVEVVHNTCDYLRLGAVYIDDYEPAAEYEVTD